MQTQAWPWDSSQINAFVTAITSIIVLLVVIYMILISIVMMFHEHFLLVVFILCCYVKGSLAIGDWCKACYVAWCIVTLFLFEMLLTPSVHLVDHPLWFLSFLGGMIVQMDYWDDQPSSFFIHQYVVVLVLFLWWIKCFFFTLSLFLSFLTFI